jgi:hypothetical protein
MLNVIRRLSELQGKPVTVTFYDQNRQSGDPSQSRLRQRLGSWRQILTLAGLIDE